MKEFRNSYKVTLMGKKSHDEFHFMQQRLDISRKKCKEFHFFFSLDKMRQAADFLKVAEQQHQDEPPTN